MDKAVIATVQHQMRVFERQEDYQEDVFRYMRMAQAKKANVVVFPALSPVMLVPPLVSSPRLGLMKQAEKGRGRWASLKDRVLGRAAGAADQVFGGGLRGEMNRLLNKAPEALYEAYVDLFSAAALKFKMTIVAGSFHLRTYEESSCKHVCFVFGPNGQIIGKQAKVHLTVEEMRFCQAGQSFKAIETEIGRIGILIGEDALFPEPSRILAYQGIDLLVNLAACDGVSLFKQMRHAFIARLDENELLGVQSCIIGPNRLTSSQQDFVGKSGLLAPIPLSSHFDGILFEMGAMTVEGIIAETINLADMRSQWSNETPRLRQGMRVLAYRPLSDAYRSLRTLDQVFYSPDAPTLVSESTAKQVSTTADELPLPSPLPKEGLKNPTSSTLDVKPEPATDFNEEDTDELERGHLNLRGADQRTGFDLLASPFSEHDSADKED